MNSFAIPRNISDVELHIGDETNPSAYQNSLSFNYVHKRRPSFDLSPTVNELPDGTNGIGSQEGSECSIDIMSLKSKNKVESQEDSDSSIHFDFSTDKRSSLFLQKSLKILTADIDHSIEKVIPNKVIEEKNNEHGQHNGDESDEIEESIFESSFDLTQDRLQHVFDSFDTDKDGLIDYNSLKLGLTQWQQQAGMMQGVLSETSTLTETAFQELVSFLDADGSGDITFEEFAKGFRLLMLRALFPSAHEMRVPSFSSVRSSSKFIPVPQNEYQSASLEVLEYNATRIKRARVGGGLPRRWSNVEREHCHRIEPEDFFFNAREDWVQNRWIDIASSSGLGSKNATALTLKRLAIKYLLHPLALEEALNANTESRPKVETFSSHYFLMMPLFCIDIAVNAETKERKIPIITVEMVSIFVNVPKNDTIITCSSSLSAGHTSRNLCFSKLDDDDSNRETETSMITNRGAKGSKFTILWRRLQQELDKPYSKLRQYDAQYLVYALLDQSVDLLIPVIRTMRNAIAEEKIYLRSNYFATDGLDRVHEIRQSIETVVRKIKPFVRVITHVIEDAQFRGSVTVYLRDVLDNLESADDDLKILIQACNDLDSDAEKFHERQMNQTLYVLTVISAIFLPVQFLTGLWGMNFDHMEELKWKYGYTFFWGLVGAFFSIPLIYYITLTSRNRLRVKRTFFG